MGGFSVPAAGTRGYDIVVSLRKFFLAVFKSSAYYPAAAAPHNGVADLFACGNAQSDITQTVLFVINGNIFTYSIFPALIQADKGFILVDFNSIFHADLIP